MRDLVAYPITRKEIISCLGLFRDKILNEQADRIGDMRPLLLQSAIDLLEGKTPVFFDDSGFLR